MKITVRLYAMLTRYKPNTSAGHPFDVELPTNSNINDLLKQLCIPPNEVKIVFVNNLIQTPDYILKEGDMVGIFPPIAGGESEDFISLDIWLYGNLANYAGEAKQPGFANIKLLLPVGTTIKDVLAHLKIPTEERGITFINGNLSAMPGVQPDLDNQLKDGDRLAFFHLRSMWPFQYRFGIPMTDEMINTMLNRDDKGLHHAYET